jgi:hypothetical protein
MGLPPITVALATAPLKKKKPGPPKTVSWKDNFHDEFNRRLRDCESCETLGEECEYLAKWFAAKKIQPPGEKKPISASRLRELYRKRNGNAETFKKQRNLYIDRYVKAGKAFLAQFPGIEPPAPPET